MKSYIYKEKIFLKIIVYFSFIFSFILFSTTTFIYFGAKYFIHSESNNQLNQELLEISEIVLKNKNLNISAYEKGSIDEGFYFKIYDKNNKIIYESDFRYNDIIANDNQNIILKKVPLMVEKSYVGQIEMFKYMKEDYTFLRKIFILIGIINIVSLIIILILGRLLNKFLSRPLIEIEETVKNITTSNLKDRVTLRGTGDEYDRLASSINFMLNRFQEAYDSQKRYSSDISHELRTPLAVIKGHVDMLNKWGKNDKEILDEGLNTIKKETDNMIFMIERLLFLAKNDNISLIISKTYFDFKDLIDEIFRETQIIDSSHILINEGKPCLINADRSLMKQMIRALLDNALKYTGNNGKITLGCYSSENTRIFYISDNGIGIPGDKINNIFDRFYRVNKDRNKTTGGSGLGLSIVKTIVEAHNGKIRIDSKIDVGTNIIIEFKDNQ